MVQRLLVPLNDFGGMTNSYFFLIMGFLLVLIHGKVDPICLFRIAMYE